MPQPAHDWTAERVRALNDAQELYSPHYECVDGELLVTPAPRRGHQRAIRVLYGLLGPYAKALGAEVLFSPLDVEMDPRTLVQPDLFVAPFVTGRARRYIEPDESMMLAVEVLSPSTARADRTVKRRRYQRAGVAEYWIVDLDARLIERWRPGDERGEPVTEVLRWQPDPARAPLAIDLEALFAEVLA